MEQLRHKLKWNDRSELAKTSFLLVIVVIGTLGGYGLFMVAMGTTTPLVVVTSYSMLPNIDRGDLLVLQGRAEENIGVGDIIVFTESGYDDPIVHRVDSIEEVEGELRFYTKGDNNDYVDSGYRTYDDIIGVYVLKIPYLGHVSLFLKGPIGMPVAIIIIIILLVVPEFVCKDDEEEAENEKEESSEIKTE